MHTIQEHLSCLMKIMNALHDRHVGIVASSMNKVQNLGGDTHMVGLISSNLICIVLDCAAKLCFLSSSGHRATSTKCGVEAAAKSCIGVESSLQALQVPGYHQKLY